MIPHPLPLEVYSTDYICLAEFSAPVPSPNQLHNIITLMCVCAYTTVPPILSHQRFAAFEEETRH